MTTANTPLPATAPTMHNFSHRLPKYAIFALAIVIPVTVILALVMGLARITLRRHREKNEAQEAQGVEATHTTRPTSMDLSALTEEDVRSNGKQELRRVTSAPPLRPSEALLLRGRCERDHWDSKRTSFDSTTAETGARED